MDGSFGFFSFLDSYINVQDKINLHHYSFWREADNTQFVQ